MWFCLFVFLIIISFEKLKSFEDRCEWVKARNKNNKQKRKQIEANEIIYSVSEVNKKDPWCFLPIYEKSTLLTTLRNKV